MSTPVQNLPPSSHQQQMIDDPTIRDVLQEMDAEVAAATANNRPSGAAPHAHPAQAQAHAAHVAAQQAAMMNYPHYAQGPPSGMFEFDLAKRALIAAVLAAIIFHPMLSQMLGTRIPLLTTNELYMSAARVLLLAVVLYVLMLKLDL